MRHRAIIVFMLALAAASPAAGRDVRPARPNIIIVIADDLGFGDIGANGSGKIRTPNIDRLARRGVNFTQFYASANVCSPSRAGLMTGRYPIRSGLAYDVLGADDPRGLPAAEETLGEIAKRAGYATKFIGKWHLGKFPDYSPLLHGFDEFYGVPHSNDMPNFALYDGDAVIEQPVEQSTLTQRYGDEAERFIRERSEQPFLLIVSHTMPHIPLYASDAYHGHSRAGLYGDVVEELDASVGRIIAALKQADAFENTAIFITSDNGPFFEGGTGGLKGGKGSSWEAGYRVPFIVSWPAANLKKGVRDAIAMNIDILPTVADMIGVDPGASTIDGRSLLGILRGLAQSAHRHLFYFNNEDIVGVRDRRWKYLTHSYYRRSLGAFEKFDQLDGFTSSYDLLFDAKDAGGEEYSFADREPEALNELKAALAAGRAKFDELRTRPPDRTFPE
ncbi:MAG: sulfatase-like hydrolase/transferase [Parvularculaceae bacterium]|nr:sulfatase-like hydrolase/transferase [Parvularculaceae bacterium]